MNMHFSKAALISAVLVLAACSGGPETAATKTAEPTGPAQPIAARSAFYQMYKPARAWAADLLPLSLTSGEVPGVKNEGGRAGVWVAVFVSPGRREARTLTYAVADSGSNIRKGVSIGGAQVWSGQTAQSKPFQSTEFLVDSDAAYKTATEDAAAWLKTNPEKKLNAFALMSAPRFPEPVWYVTWGDKTSGYAVFVNATTGTVVRRRKG